MARPACLSAIASAALYCLAATAQAQAADSPDAWHFAVTPYLWLPNINGTLTFNPPAGGGPGVEIGPYDWLEHLSGMLMIAGEARRGPWAVLADFVYLDFNDQRSRVKEVDFDLGPAGRVPVAAEANLDAKTDFTGGQLSLAGAYRVRDDSLMSVDLLAGLRYLGVEGSAEWRLAAAVEPPGGGSSFAASGSVSERVDLWTVIVGARGRVQLGGGRWFMPWLVDAGTGSSASTWQAALGVGYAFGWGEMALTYRYLAYDMDEGKLLQDMHFGGPAVSARFRF
jgi:hypothetical protein